jgi:catechol 2,3-dioxygenase-like lactoylglutathione lyase family enzyme
MSAQHEFRFAYFTSDYDATVRFYRDGLELPLINDWDRGPGDKGSVFGAAAGLIEVLARPDEGKTSHMLDERPPQGAFMVIEVENVEEDYRRAVKKDLPIAKSLKDQPWGHRNFCLTEPGGLVLYFYQAIKL